jgi:alcohol dehydrogenase
MQEFAFTIPTLVRFGNGVSEEAGQIIESLSEEEPPKILLITDEGVREAGLLGDITASMTSVSIDFDIFDQVEPNPRDTTVIEIAEAYRSFDASMMIAVGGGSVMDSAKAAGVIAAYGGHPTDYDGWDLMPGPIPPLVAIPTTAGTASEVTFWAVITDTENRVKIGIGGTRVAAKLALVDPLLTHSLPRSLTIGTGLDALTHAIEAYTCKVANPVSDVLALRAIQLVADHLPSAAEQPNGARAREGMMLASLVAGLSFANANTASVHSLSESIGAMYDAPHGMLNGIMLPYVMAFNLPTIPERSADIASALGGKKEPEEAVRKVVELLDALGVPSLADLGAKGEDLQELALMSAEHPCTLDNPRPMAVEDMRQVLEEALAQRPPV